MSQYHINDNTNSFNNTTITNNITIADERSNILAWLSPLEPRLRHQDIREHRVEKVGGWLLLTEEFRDWYAGSGGSKSDNAVLFCYGDPGVGKTYISSLVVDSLCDQVGGKNATVSCFYFDFAAQKEQSTTVMLGALLKQLVGGMEKIPEEISRAFQDQKKSIGGRGPQLSDIVKMMQTTTSKEPMFICIDALDECVEGNRAKLLDSLNRILQKSPRTRIFVTGRSHIRPEIGRRLSGRVRSISISPMRADVIRYLHTKLDEDTIPDAMDSSLEADILKIIPEDISEIFLLVSLNIDAILQETTIHRRRQRLSTMTDGLGLEDVYGATLGRIKRQGGEKARLGIATLMWISHAERSLKPDELCHALAVEIESPNINTENVPSIGTLLTCCQGLIVVDKEAFTVRLIHFTVQEYLCAHPELFSRAHSTMAETCLSYLNSSQVKALSTTPSLDLRVSRFNVFPSPISGLRDTPFLEYSSLYWGVHAKRDLSDCAKLLAQRLFDDYNNHISIKILLKARRPYWNSSDFDRPLLFGGLHCASLFGIVEVVANLVEVGGCDINQQDCIGNTSLHYAISNGHEGVVEVLLGRDEVNPDKPDDDGQTPLHCAAMNGHEGVVKILLGRNEVNPGKLDAIGRTPLHYAALGGHEGVVKILLGRDEVNPEKPDGGETPLHCAAWNGHEGVVKILLGRGEVNPEKSDAFGQTPLHNAAKNGHEEVVKLLLGQGEVNPDKPDIYGKTPLHCAAMNWNDGVVKILLERREVNPENPDIYGKTPLHYAASNGREGAVKMLLERSEVNPEKPDICGKTPLYCAAMNGRQGVVKTLLEQHGVSADKPDIYGKTPLHCAAMNGQEGVVKILLEQGDTNPDKPDDDGQTPLYCASSNGHEEVVGILLGRAEVNPDNSYISGQTPLHRAAKGGHEGVVKTLLGRDEVNPDKPNIYGQTPLYCAAENGHEGVVKILLDRGDINPNNPDNDGQTPLHCAAEDGHTGVVKMLLGRAGINSNKPNNHGRTPLDCAVKNKHQEVIALLQSPQPATPSIA